MKRLLTILLATALLLPFFSSCVHEWPDNTTPAGIILDFKFDTDLPPYLTVNYETKTKESEIEHSIRYTVEAYRLLPSGDYNEIPDARFSFLNDNVKLLDYTAEISLPEGKYKILSWVDYVKKGDPGHLYYDNTNFKETILTEGHKANTDYRDAFTGYQEIEVIRLPSTSAPITYQVNMQRPLAKFDIVATDVEEFLTKQLEAMRNKTKGETDTKGPLKLDIDDYTVKVSYVGFMPNSFNILTNKPNDAITGVLFESKIKYITDSEASLGFDYVFVNGKESIVQIKIEIYDKEGDRVASTRVIDVPLLRSKLTTVKGEFLTSTAKGGVGINPGFDGDYNIEIE